MLVVVVRERSTVVEVRNDTAISLAGRILLAKYS